MNDGLFTKQGKKLMMVGVFLWCVAMLIGGEDDPGMLAKVSDTPGHAQVGASHPAPQGVQPPQASYQAVQPAQQDPELDAWYGEAAPAEVVDPTPPDQSAMINDAKPAVSAAPVAM